MPGQCSPWNPGFQPCSLRRAPVGPASSCSWPTSTPPLMPATVDVSPGSSQVSRAGVAGHWTPRLGPHTLPGWRSPAPGPCVSLLTESRGGVLSGPNHCFWSSSLLQVPWGPHCPKWRFASSPRAHRGMAAPTPCTRRGMHRGQRYPRRQRCCLAAEGLQGLGSHPGAGAVGMGMSGSCRGEARTAPAGVGWGTCGC